MYIADEIMKRPIETKILKTAAPPEINANIKKMAV